jgi:uncharacterized metal-binding protein YceD (DUF177 family)
MASEPPSKSEPALAWQHTVRGAGTRPVEADRTATSAECKQLAVDLGIVSVEAFHAHYAIEPKSGGSFVMSGTFKASVTQACVVSLDPVTQDIEDGFSVKFCPPSQITELEGKDRPILDEPDVEALNGDTIEAGRVLYELLGAALDPYPRKDEASFAWKDPKTGPDDEKRLNPFAALAKLKPEGT